MTCLYQDGVSRDYHAYGDSVDITHEKVFYWNCVRLRGIAIDGNALLFEEFLFFHKHFLAFESVYKRNGVQDYLYAYNLHSGNPIILEFWLSIPHYYTND
jgi:hypothetical protein